MANKRFDHAPKFVVKDDSVVIQQAAGSSASLLDVKDHTGSSLMSITSTGAMTGANLTSPALTGTPTAPTATAGTNTTQIATTAFVRTELSNLVDAAPSALDTLNELAAALGDDANFSSTITTALGLKAPLASPTFTGTVVLPSNASIGAVSSTELQYLDGATSSIQTQLNSKANTASPTLSETTTVSTLNITSSYQLNGNTLVNLRFAEVSQVLTASAADYLINLPPGVDMFNFVSITPISNFDNNIVWLFGWALGHWGGIHEPYQIRIRAQLGNGVHLGAAVFRVYYRG